MNLLNTQQLTTLEKLAVTALWVGVSAAVSYGVTYTTGHPDAFLEWTPVVNLVLVALKNLIDPNVRNI